MLCWICLNDVVVRVKRRSNVVMLIMMYGLFIILLVISVILSWILNIMYVSRCVKVYIKVYMLIICLNCIGFGFGSYLVSGLRVSVSKRK